MQDNSFNMNKVLLTIILLTCVSYGFTQVINKSEILMDENLGKEFLVMSYNTQKVWMDTTVDFCFHDWDTISNSWKISYKNSRTYNASGDLTINQWLYWDVTNNVWINDEKLEYTYNSYNRVAESLDYIWNTSLNSWEYYKKVVYTYDTTLLISTVTFNWNSTSSFWKESLKTEFISYDSFQNLLESISYSWDNVNSEWDNTLRFVYTRDSFGNTLESISYQWFGSWVYNRKFEYTYNGNDVHSYRYTWNGSAWNLDQERFNEYDVNGWLIESRSYSWNSSTSSFVGIQKLINTYDIFGNVTELITMSWDNIGNDWINNEKTIYNYDNNNKTEVYIYTWNQQLSIWENKGWEVICPLITNVIDIPIKNISVIFPNPSKGIVGIDIQDKVREVKVYTIKGDVVFEDNSTTLDLTSLSNGIYYITVKTDFSIYRNKLVLIK